MKLRETKSSIPIIAMTGRPEDADVYLNVAKALGAQRVGTVHTWCVIRTFQTRLLKDSLTQTLLKNQKQGALAIVDAT